MQYEQVMATQYGGNHYKDRAIQPWEVWEAYDMNGWQASALKYLLRYKDKGKPLEDLYKCLHNVQYLIAKEERKAMAKKDISNVIDHMVSELTK
ncbi:SaV-like [uncultured Caudovirales phage]|uniref:SaV-like n=1 Tax=uncultured Caudovirales phage TaxID=2100421 RepID=A0A6J5M288_9CAUD|nr:SaV-like [uncultured Caudovirales phage]